MHKPYLIMVNELIFARKLTRAGALKVVYRLQRERRLKAVIAYELRKPLQDSTPLGIHKA